MSVERKKFIGHRIHSISYNKLYLSFLLYRAFVREVSIKLYLSYEFFSYDRHDRYDRYNDMETRLNHTRDKTNRFPAARSSDLVDHSDDHSYD